MANTVMTKPENAVAAFNPSMFDAYSGAGGEHVTNDDRKIPLLKVLEPLADNLKKNNSKFIPGASAGDIVDTAINEVIGKNVKFLPVMFVPTWIEWKDKKVVERYKDEADIPPCEWQSEDGRRKGNFRTDNGNEISKTMEFYGINLSSEGNPWCCISMSRGRIGAGKTFLSYLERVTLPSGKRAPFFYKVWDLSAIEETRDDNVYHTWSAKAAGLLQEQENAGALYEQAIAFYEILNEGRAVAEVDEDAGATSSKRMDDALDAL